MYCVERFILSDLKESVDILNSNHIRIKNIHHIWIDEVLLIIEPLSRPITLTQSENHCKAIYMYDILIYLLG